MGRPKLQNQDDKKTAVISARVTGEDDGKLNQVASRLKGQKNLKAARSEVIRIALHNLFSRLEKAGKL